MFVYTYKTTEYRYSKQCVVSNKRGEMEAYAEFLHKMFKFHQTGVSIEIIACQQ